MSKLKFGRGKDPPILTAMGQDVADPKECLLNSVRSLNYVINYLVIVLLFVLSGTVSQDFVCSLCASIF